MRLSTASPCAYPIAGPSARGSGKTGYFVQNARKRHITSNKVRAARAIVRHRSDLIDPNNRTNEARPCQLGRVLDHRGGLTFGNSVWPFARPLYRWKRGGITTGEYKPSSTSSWSGPMSRWASPLDITRVGSDELGIGVCQFLCRAGFIRRSRRPRAKRKFGKVTKKAW